MAVPDAAKRSFKRLIVCCDGTWQSSVTSQKNVPSNVTRLARSFAREVTEKDGKHWQQIVHYDAGIGTGEITKSEKRRQGGFGHGFIGNVIEAYNFLALNYEKGDKVYCFGFSRGAYTARAVAGLVNDIGIISARDMQDFPELYKAYRDYEGDDPHGFRQSAAYRKWQYGVRSSAENNTNLKTWDKIPHAPVDESSRIVEVVGVFDTVGALGVPSSPFWTVRGIMTAVNAWMGGEKPGFHNVNLSPYIRNAFHAMALDEHRKPFAPTLWHIADSADEADNVSIQCTEEEALKEFKDLHKDNTAIKREELDKHEKKIQKAWEKLVTLQMRNQRAKFSGEKVNLKQVWFPGVHINVGGGNSDALEDRRGDFEQIALISFAWMVAQCKPHLEFEPRIRKLSVRDRMALILPIQAEILRQQQTWYGRFIKSMWRGLEVLRPKTIVGWAEGPIVDSYTFKMRLAGSQHRTPGEYGYAPPDPKNKDPPQKRETNESIHPSVTYRMRAGVGYSPKALKGFTRDRVGDKWVWSKPAGPQKHFWQFWKKNQSEMAVQVDEYEIPKFDSSKKAVAGAEKPATTGDKFSWFLTTDYVDFLRKLEIQEEDDLRSPKTLAEWKDAEKHLENSAEETNATKFLKATWAGKEWPEVKPQPLPK